MKNLLQCQNEAVAWLESFLKAMPEISLVTTGTDVISKEQEHKYIVESFANFLDSEQEDNDQFEVSTVSSQPTRLHVDVKAFQKIAVAIKTSEEGMFVEVQNDGEIVSELALDHDDLGLNEVMTTTLQSEIDVQITTELMEAITKENPLEVRFDLLGEHEGRQLQIYVKRNPNHKENNTESDPYIAEYDLYDTDETQMKHLRAPCEEECNLQVQLEEFLIDAFGVEVMDLTTIETKPMAFGHL